jgi:galactan endo-1,6-beta-galactosidase
MPLFSRRSSVTSALSLLMLGGTVTGTIQNAQADYTLVVDKNENRGTWEGWGCSLCWWANALGGSSYQNLYADLFFTQNTVSFAGKTLPGLGMNIARYNVGGVGRGDTIDGTTENLPSGFPVFKRVEGYWKDWHSSDPASSSWDWSRDSNQRNMLRAARDRGVNQIEFFSNAPLWWMTDKKSSAGGALQSGNRRDHARYLATVVKQAQDKWGVTVNRVAPFNEPSAGWWNYPGGQEGCNIAVEQQKEILGYLREELDSRGLNKVAISGSDENSVDRAEKTHNYFKAQSVTVNGKSRNVADLLGQVNAHSYYGLEPFRDNATRQRFRTALGKKRLWMSEYGDNDGSGMALAQTIMEDMTYLKPTAWIYWQPAEPSSTWGLVNGDYGNIRTLSEPARGTPTWVYYKYYVMAQFTRFLRPGYKILGNTDHNTIAAYDEAGHRLVLIVVNYGNAQQITSDLSCFSQVGTSASVTVTNTNGSRLLQNSTIDVSNKRLVLPAEANSIYSVVVSGVTF